MLRCARNCSRATSGQGPAKKKKKVEAGPRDYNVPCLIAYGDSCATEDMSSHASPKEAKDKAGIQDGHYPLQHLRIDPNQPHHQRWRDRAEATGEVFKLLPSCHFIPGTQTEDFP